MKTKLIYLLLGGILISSIFIWKGSTEEQGLDPSQKASFSAIKCTVAKYLFEVDTTRQIAPLFENLGDHHFAISTSSTKAQAFFDQGLRLTYAFNHAEAHRSFMEASRQDPNSAMAYWGQAYTLGPNINDAMPDDERKTKAYEALMKATERMNEATPKEKALINALRARYSEDLSAELGDLNTAYMEVMKKVQGRFPGDADIQTLYAASVMNTMPWNYWDNDGNPMPHTEDAKKALESAISINPDHPGAHHYYIHMVELPKPDLAVPSADRLGSLMPAAGHLVHMPSHIYIRVGRYKDAVESNQKAILADEDYISQCFSQGMYPLGYYPHNIHFLWSASSLLGASETAIEAAKKTAEKVPLGELETLPFLQDFASTPLLAYTRFGKWNQILTIPYPGDKYKHLKLIWHYSRGIAFLRKDNIKEANEELFTLETLLNDPGLEEVVANYTNPSSEIAKVAHKVLAAEVSAYEGDMSEAISLLKKAVELEDKLIYSEPSPWHIPTRQSLGYFLMKDGQFEAAEKIYREDLDKIRQNGWSLMGLHNSLKAQGKTEEAAQIKMEFDKAWEHADIKIENSIL